MRRENALYGRELGRRFHLEAAPAFVTQTLKSSEIAVTSMRLTRRNSEITDPLPVEDAHIVALPYEACDDHEIWLEGKCIDSEPFRAGVTTFYDLRRAPRAFLRNPYHLHMFYLSRSALDAIADDAGVPRIGDLWQPHGVGADDPVMRGLGSVLLSAFVDVNQANPMFVEHVTRAVGVHIAHTYGGMRSVRLMRGGLTEWQERRAKELIEAHIDGGLSVTRLAKECGLSVTHFSRAFRRSVGMPPHQWLLHRRVDKARSLLECSKQELSAIALACGFADQSHFTRVFSRLVGTSPRAWRLGR
jgi:AraC-like DNA-binding protein